MRRIVVRLEDVEKFCPNGKAKRTVGRPMKAGAFRLFAYAAVRIHFEGLPRTQEELVLHLLEHPPMPKADRPGETTIREIVRELFLAFKEYSEGDN